jgi:hypothetical protein
LAHGSGPRSRATSGVGRALRLRRVSHGKRQAGAHVSNFFFFLWCWELNLGSCPTRQVLLLT